jgi:hypothetical protein
VIEKWHQDQMVCLGGITETNVTDLKRRLALCLGEGFFCTSETNDSRRTYI